MKRFYTGLLVGLIAGLILTTTTFAIADQQIKLIVNGKEIQSDVPPQIINGRTMVPARFLAEALGAKVEWDEVNHAVVVTCSIKANGTQPPVTYESNNNESDWISLDNLAEEYNVYIKVGENVTLRKGDKTIEFPTPKAYQGQTAIISVTPSLKIKIVNARLYLSLNDLKQAGFIP